MEAIDAGDEPAAAVTAAPGQLWPWTQIARQVSHEARQRGADLSRVLVLVPAVAHIVWAARAWHAVMGDGFAPRVETAQTWAARVAGMDGRAGAVPDAGGSADAPGLRMDRALDLLQAGELLRAAGLRDLSRVGAARLLDAAMQVAEPLRAVPPPQRQAWLARAVAVSGADVELLRAESAIQKLALHWAHASEFVTDVLWSDVVAQTVDLLIVVRVPGVQALHLALGTQWGDRSVLLDWPAATARPAMDATSTSVSAQFPAAAPMPLPGGVRLHACADAADEAQRAAACVIDHLRQGRRPVALVAQDRVLVRRVRALLDLRGVSMLDEAGWKLSTTGAAGVLMSMLRVAVHVASCDAVLAFLKHAAVDGPAQDQAGAGDADAVRTLEAWLRKQGIGTWRAGIAGRAPEPAAQMAARVDALRARLREPRPIATWVGDCAELMSIWPGLCRLADDAAGAAVLRALRLGPDQTGLAHMTRRLSLHEFMSWVSDVLESAGFRPGGGGGPGSGAAHDVVILALDQVPGRPVAALVVPGCDETHLPASVQPAGDWTAAQRAVLGLPDRAALSEAMLWAWREALSAPVCDLLWRRAEGAEVCLPSPLIRLLELQAGDAGAGHAVAHGTDPRIVRPLAPGTPPEVRPVATSLVPVTLSASGYADLRACPYRFFALRLVGLAPADELDTPVDKRDFGNWLHLVLSRYHATDESTGQVLHPAGQAWLDQCAESARRDLALDEAEFLPFAAVWPSVRAAYLDWQSSREAQGWRVAQVESPGAYALDWAHSPGPDGGPHVAGRTTLRGRIDRVDRADHADQAGHVDQAGQAGVCVIDYKTESTDRTKQRLKEPHEDTQLAFYAALLGGDGGGDGTPRGAYLNLSDRDGVRWMEMPDLGRYKALLLQGIAQDIARIAAGAELRPLGAAQACEYCQARGLCRKDFRRDGPDGGGAAQ